MVEFEYYFRPETQVPSIVDMRNSLTPLEGENRLSVEFWLDAVHIVATGETLKRFCTPLWLFIEELKLNDEKHFSGEEWSFKGVVAQKCWTRNGSNEVEGYYTPENNSGYIVFIE